MQSFYFEITSQLHSTKITPDLIFRGYGLHLLATVLLSYLMAISCVGTRSPPTIIWGQLCKISGLVLSCDFWLVLVRGWVFRLLLI